MPVVQANGISQHYATMGPVTDPSAPVVVLIHGILIDSLASYFFTIAKPFADAGVGTVMYDSRGHGKSDKPPAGYTMADYAADLIALLDELGLQRPVYLMGNSFGGSLALYTAGKFPDRVAGVVMVEAEAPTYEWASRLSEVFAETRKQLSRREVIAWLGMRYGRHMAKQGKAAIGTLTTTRIEEELPHGDMLTHDELAAVSCPVLAIYAGEWHIKDEAPQLVAWVRDCSTTVIEGQDHSILVNVPGTVCGLALPWIADKHALAQASGRQ